MKLDIQWGDFEPFLKIRRQQSNLSIQGHKGRFRVLREYFKDIEFNSDNFEKFVYYEIDQAGKSNSLYNNYLKLVKHLAVFLKLSDEFHDYRFRDDHTGQPENILTPNQITKLAECRIKYLRFKNRREKYRALIYFLGTMGSRINETLLLEWPDIKQDDRVSLIHFRKEVTKGSKERFVPAPKWLIKSLLKLPRENQFVFSKIDAANFRRDLEERGTKAGIPFHVTPHTFRDSSISNKLEVEIPLQEVTTLHGHSTTTTTFKYYTRIQAKKLASSLYQRDPAFQEDQTYASFIQLRKEDTEKTLNTRVCDYICEENVTENNKRVFIMKFIEK